MSADAADQKTIALAMLFYDNDLRTLVDDAIKLAGVDLKKDPKTNYKTSRMVFKAMMAAAAQRILEDGGNQKLLEDTYSTEDAWSLYLLRNPEIAAKLEAQKPKAPPKPKTGKQKKLGLKLIEGGLSEIVMDDKDCDCACHPEPLEHGCAKCSCINEIDGDEVL